MDKVEMGRMTFSEFKTLVRERPVVLIPVASIEEHGPQAPMGDYIITEDVARLICRRTNAIMTPVIPFGYSEYFHRFPGTITLRAPTLAAVVEDVCTSLLEHGLDHLILFNGHRGNNAILEQVGRQIRRTHGVILAEITPWEFLTPAFMQEVYGEDVVRTGHGSDPATSLNLYLQPEDVNMKLIEEGVLRANATFGPFKVQGTGKVKVGDAHATLYLNYDDIAPNGVVGDARIASRDKGERMVRRIVDRCVEFVEAFASLETHIGQADAR